MVNGNWYWKTSPFGAPIQMTMETTEKLLNLIDPTRCLLGECMHT